MTFVENKRDKSQNLLKNVDEPIENNFVLQNEEAIENVSMRASDFFPLEQKQKEIIDDYKTPNPKNFIKDVQFSAETKILVRPEQIKMAVNNDYIGQRPKSKPRTTANTPHISKHVVLNQ